MKIQTAITVMALAMITASVNADVLINRRVDEMRKALTTHFTTENMRVYSNEQQIDGSHLLTFRGSLSVTVGGGVGKCDVEVTFIMKQVIDGTMTLAASDHYWTPSTDYPEQLSPAMETLALELASRIQ
jgi:hypothetical protein